MVKSSNNYFTRESKKKIKMPLLKHRRSELGHFPLFETGMYLIRPLVLIRSCNSNKTDLKIILYQKTLMKKEIN